MRLQLCTHTGLQVPSHRKEQVDPRVALGVRPAGPGQAELTFPLCSRLQLPELRLPQFLTLPLPVSDERRRINTQLGQRVGCCVSNGSQQLQCRLPSHGHVSTPPDLVACCCSLVLLYACLRLPYCISRALQPRKSRRHGDTATTGSEGQPIWSRSSTTPNALVDTDVLLAPQCRPCHQLWALTCLCIPARAKKQPYLSVGKVSYELYDPRCKKQWTRGLCVCLSKPRLTLPPVKRRRKRIEPAPGQPESSVSCCATGQLLPCTKEKQPSLLPLLCVTVALFPFRVALLSLPRALALPTNREKR